MSQNAQFAKPNQLSPHPQQYAGNFAGKNSLKLAQYYEPLGGWNFGRIEQNTFDNRPNGVEIASQGSNSPKADRMLTDDIDGTKPNAFGRAARFAQGKDHMSIGDIPGAKPRYLELEERRAKIGNQRANNFMDVKDINNESLKARNLYKRNVDPLDPVY